MRKSLSLLLLMLCPVLAQAELKVGTVAVYSDGRVEKLLEKGQDWTLWEDERKRRYKRSNLPFLPVLMYQRFPSDQPYYSQKVVTGSPHNLKPYGDMEAVMFDITRTQDGVRSKKIWRCEYRGKNKFKYRSKVKKTERYRCTRLRYQTNVVPVPMEKLDLEYSPSLGLVVDQRRTDRKGEKKRVRLHRLISPEKATLKRISRTVYQLKTSR